MLGLFLVLPVLSPYASSLGGASPILIGLAVGAFPLTQTLFQVPFGWFSDWAGRKPVIVAGLLLFVGGSLLAAGANSIYGLIAGFCLQGAGAVGSVVVALLADLTRNEVRTRAMAMIGGSVGLALGIGFVGGPLIAELLGVPAIFLLIAGLAGLAVPTVLFLVPDPVKTTSADGRSLSINRLTTILKDSNLWRLHTGIFTANTTLRALFVVIPFSLESFLGNGREWLVYLSVLLVSGLIMFPTIFVAERKGRIRDVLMVSVGVLSTGLVLFLVAQDSFTGFLVSLTFYFVGFSLIEAILPSLVTRIAGESERGTAMGIFNMSQYLGAFIGSILGGFFLRTTEIGTTPHSTPWLFGGLIVLVTIWSLFVKDLSVNDSTVTR
jgi:MFS family permease